MLRRRKSTFLHGIEDDAREVVEALNGYLNVPRLGGTAPSAASATDRVRVRARR
jgi:hypothetical protein